MVDNKWENAMYKSIVYLSLCHEEKITLTYGRLGNTGKNKNGIIGIFCRFNWDLFISFFTVAQLTLIIIFFLHFFFLQNHVDVNKPNVKTNKKGVWVKWPSAGVKVWYRTPNRFNMQYCNVFIWERLLEKNIVIIKPSIKRAAKGGQKFENRAEFNFANELL